MSLVTNTVTTYAGSKSLREDLNDMIYNIAPVDTPLVTLAKKDTANGKYFEWQTDGLRAPSTTNARIEGDDMPAVDAFTATNRVGNYCQINGAVIMVSGTEEVVRKAGIKSMVAYQIAQRSKEVKRDIEAVATSDTVAVVGNASTARQTAGLGSWLITNFYSVAGAAGTAPQMSSSSDGYPQTAAQDGSTPIDFTETHLKTMISKVYDQGGDIHGSVVMVSPANKARASGFTGIATKYKEVPAGKQAEIVAAADVYVSDFGTLKIVPNRFQPKNRAYLVDPNLVSLAYLRPFTVDSLGKNGDATKRQIIVEWGLRVKNEKGLGTVRGITTT